MSFRDELFNNIISKATCSDGIYVNRVKRGEPVNIRLNTLDGLRGIKLTSFYSIKILADIIVVNLIR